MSYTKNTWVDQQGQVRYTETEEDGYKIFTANYEQVTELGTPVNADNMNHIEDGIADCFDYVDTEVTTAKNYALNLLKTIYPVGSVYIGTQSSCPMGSLFGAWTLVSSGKALWTGNGSNGNTTIAAGLPNIKGDFVDLISHDTQTMGNATGAFAVYARNDNAIHAMSGGATGVTKDGISFNASRSSSIYRDGVTTVQPPAYVVNVWRRTA